MWHNESRKRGVYLTDQEVLQLHISMVPFLSAVLGSGCEVVVHDISDPAHSVVAISNSLSGRGIGDPMTDLPVDQVEGSDFVANYSGRSKGNEFLSCTYYIKNEGRLIGLLCVNKDVSYTLETQRALSALLKQFNLIPSEDTTVSENLDGSVDEIMRTRIAETITQCMVSPSRMSLEEKVRVVHLLKADGVLSMKGAMAELASQLNVSVPTIYRYLNRCEEE